MLLTLIFFFGFWSSPCSPQGLFLAVCSQIHPVLLRGPNEMPGTSRLAMSMANALTLIYCCRITEPQKHYDNDSERNTL